MTMFSRRFSRSSVLAVHGAVEEAELRGDPRIGTEHLLLGLLRDAGSGPASILGVDLATARTALHALDVQALRAFGVDPEGFGPLTVVRRKRHLAFTSRAKAALERTVADAARTRSRRAEPVHLLAALLAGTRPDPALDVLDRLAIDVDAARARLDAGEAGAA
jgi:ATP-dependent Clp protease ATP-binding subunit ClpA